MKNVVLIFSDGGSKSWLLGTLIDLGRAIQISASNNNKQVTIPATAQATQLCCGRRLGFPSLAGSDNSVPDTWVVAFLSVGLAQGHTVCKHSACRPRPPSGGRPASRVTELLLKC